MGLASLKSAPLSGPRSHSNFLFWSIDSYTDFIKYSSISNTFRKHRPFNQMVGNPSHPVSHRELYENGLVYQ